jgi:hypothetical protein
MRELNNAAIEVKTTYDEQETELLPISGKRCIADVIGR